MIKVHPLAEKHKDDIVYVAEMIGLDAIDYDKPYSLFKTRAKTASSVGYPDKMLALKFGYFCLTGTVDKATGEILVWLAGESFSEWFVTSPILSCVKIGKKYVIETRNSYYELKPEGERIKK